MYIKNCLALFIILSQLFLSQLIAQESNEKVSISGKIVDEAGQSIPYAAISVMRSSDSKVISGTVTDMKGEFEVAVIPGTYQLSITFLSYSDKVIEDIQVENKNVKLNEITLQSSSLNLEEITVTAEKKLMELKLDKRVFNVSKDISNIGSNASEVLDNLPSVEVDVDGNVSLRGSGNVRILIDGKVSGLVGMSGADALRQLQASMIESVEVITNPSARYDAEGEVGIINIVLKKEKQKGLNGTFDLSTGIPENHGAAYSLNFRKSKLNVFSSFGLNYRKNPGSGFSYQEFYNSSSFDILESNRKHERGGLSGNFNLGAEYSFNPFNSLAASALFQKSDNDNEVNIKYDYFNFGNELLEAVERNESEKEEKEVIEGNLNYTRLFQQKDRKLTADFKYISSIDLEQAQLNEISSKSDVLPVKQRTDNSENEINYLLQSDYVHPFKKDGLFETGLRSTIREIDNDFLLEQQSLDGIYTPVAPFNNQLKYNENIYAAYIMAGNKRKQLSYQFGLRWEYSDIRTELVETKEVNNFNYHNLFPSAHFSYELKKENSVQLSYSRRISRPGFRDLLPFYGYSDSRNFYGGNPELQPEFTHVMELGHLKYWKKGSLLSSIYYRYTTGVVERISVSDSAGFTRRFPINLSTQNSYGVEFNYSYDVVKWWKFTSSFNFFRAIVEGNFMGQQFNSDTYTWNSTGNSKFSINKQTDLQLSFNYRAPRLTTQGRSRSYYSIDLGMAKDVLNGKGTISANVRDIFNTRKRRSVIETAEFFSESEFQWRARQLRINFTYRLNSTKKAASRGNREGAFGDDE